MLQLNLLGEQRLTTLGVDLVAGGSRAVELLAYLVLHPGIRVPRPVLAGTFWPDTPEAQAMTNLRRELHNLRQLLEGTDCLAASDGAIGWLPDPGLRVDVQVFAAERDAALAATGNPDAREFLDHAQLALDEYRGDLMPGNYSDWVPAARERIRDECTALCDDAVAAWTALGEGRRALAVAGQRIAIQPLEEAGYRGLIRAHLALGDRAAALHAFHRCTAVLERELGVAPSAETRNLLGPGRPPLAGPANPLAGPGSIGRAREMAVLRQCWEETRAGRGGLLVLSGAPGVGKTHLAAALGDLARATGAVVAQARCVDASGRIPLAPVAGWLRGRDFAPVLATLPAPLRREAARLLPEVLPEPAERQDPVPKEGPGRAMVDAWQRYRFFEALAATVEATGRPTLFVLDDLQWCDADTAAWMAYLMGSGRTANLLLAATLRAGGEGGSAAVAGLLQGARSAGQLREMTVKPLDAAASGELAGHIRGHALDEDETRLLQAATGGYPLYVLEAARAFPEAEPLPEAGFGPLLGRRIQRLGPRARHVAELAAAFGHDISLDLLSEAGDLESAELVDAIDELWGLGILLPVGPGYGFAHNLLRAAAYEGATPAKRWLLHRRLAQGLELLHAGNLDAVASTLAEQYTLGSSPERALPFHLRAGADAARVFANSAALKSYGRALGLIAARPAGRARDAAELSVRRSMSPPQTALLGYSSAELLGNLDRIRELALSLGHREVLADSLIGLFAGRYVQGRIGPSYKIARQALELAGDDPDLLGQAHFAVAGAAQGLGRAAEAIGHFALCSEIGRPGYSYILGTRLEIHARGWASHAHWLVGDDARATELADEALSMSGPGELPYTRAVALAYAALLQQLRGDTAALELLAAELLGLCRRYDLAYYGQWGEILQGWMAGGPEGTAQIRAGIATLRAHDALARMPYWLSLLAGNLSAEGDAKGACAVLDAALATAEQHSDSWWLPEVLRLRAGHARGPARRAMLDRARALAGEQGSVALLRRLEGDANA
ncbi:ATP-binding protein [Paeniglutamicibacter sp. NPDC012692]|uniref:ATP-binding protein n=1 Tax=Paeniglutamicibacter sp. NPDC012692 TaxID=3364388 RepID=UPI0036B26222